MTDVQLAQSHALTKLNVEFGWRIGVVPPCVYGAALHVAETGAALGQLTPAVGQQIVALRQPYLDVYAPAFGSIMGATTAAAVEAVTWTWPASS